jgi:hypothetical protein
MSSLHEEEVWRPIAGYEGFYEVSSHGRVRSLDRITSHGHRRRGAVLRPDTQKRGHQSVRLCKNHEIEKRLVHRLVLEAFVGPCPEGMECCHGPAGVLDNSVGNLSWGTKSKNNGEDKRRDETDNRGMKHAMARLTEWQVINILADDRPYQKIADDYGVSKPTITAIKTGRNWGWLSKSCVRR